MQCSVILVSGLLLLPSNTQSTLLSNAGASGVPTTVKKLNIARLVLVRPLLLSLCIFVLERYFDTQVWLTLALEACNVTNDKILDP